MRRFSSALYVLCIVAALGLVACGGPRPGEGVPQIPAPPDVAAAPADAVRSPTNLASKVITPGTGTRHPRPNSTVTVHYTGWTTDGRTFDSSVSRGEPS